MLIVLGFYKRNPKLTWEEFSQHWQNVHGPMISNLPIVKRHMKRYIQHHLRPQTDFEDVQSLDFDGFSETWFENAEARRQIVENPDFVAKVREDDKILLDLTKVRTIMYDQQIVEIGPKPVYDGHLVRFV